MQLGCKSRPISTQQFRKADQRACLTNETINKRRRRRIYLFLYIGIVASNETGNFTFFYHICSNSVKRNHPRQRQRTTTTTNNNRERSTYSLDESIGRWMLEFPNSCRTTLSRRRVDEAQQSNQLHSPASRGSLAS